MLFPRCNCVLTFTGTNREDSGSALGLMHSVVNRCLKPLSSLLKLFRQTVHLYPLLTQCKVCDVSANAVSL